MPETILNVLQRLIHLTITTTLRNTNRILILKDVENQVIERLGDFPTASRWRTLDLNIIFCAG